VLTGTRSLFTVSVTIKYHPQSVLYDMAMFHIDAKDESA